ncbi:hypothetical protein HJC23_003328 [Cyclotella cryptica]|uniref:Uncharacterized protein n=1 Tax=Cyclotella cryptica TaxID=29204 RepID=A0ABD3QXW2_9STRA
MPNLQISDKRKWDEHRTTLAGDLNVDTETPCKSEENRYLSPMNHLEWEGINGKKQLVSWLDFYGTNLSNCYYNNNCDNHDGTY